ncbi:hypothetical protein [Phytoactinopolyspora endophytica]|uniref:hypothetical protein n=1 Tax=Phytoactinopolyspora endophytica TaxID=1642495 RepID=UPI00101D2420|nr:hypothetical protein [Phytoactinopolyspora endophytica]
MFQFGTAAYAELSSTLVTLLSATFVVGIALLLMSAVGHALRAVGLYLYRRHCERQAEACRHAEALRGISELEQYLGRRDATP